MMAFSSVLKLKTSLGGEWKNTELLIELPEWFMGNALEPVMMAIVDGLDLPEEDYAYLKNTTRETAKIMRKITTDTGEVLRHGEVQ